MKGRFNVFNIYFTTSDPLNGHKYVSEDLSLLHITSFVLLCFLVTGPCFSFTVLSW